MLRSTRTRRGAPLTLAILPVLFLIGCGAERAELDGLSDEEQSGVAVTRGAIAPSFNPELTSTITYLQNYVENALVAGYEAELLYSNGSLGWDNVFARYSTDNWASYNDVPYVIEPTATHIHATIDIPEAATQLEYAVYRKETDGTLYWDNNRGRNFKVKVHASLRRINVLENVRSIRYITKLNSAVIHYGVNGWNDVREANMNFDDRAFSATGVRQYATTISGLTASDRLDFVVRDNEYNWDNNGGKDYFHIDSTMSIDVYPTVPLSTEIVGQYVRAYKDGIYYDAQPISTHHSGYYIYATFSNVDRADWIFVIDVIKDGARYYGAKEYRAEGAASRAEIGIEITQREWAH